MADQVWHCPGCIAPQSSADFPGARAAIRAVKAKAEHLTPQEPERTQPQEPTELHSVVTIEAPGGERLAAFRFSTDAAYPWMVLALNQTGEALGMHGVPSCWERLGKMGTVTLPDKPGVTIPEGRIPGIDHPITDGLFDDDGDEWVRVDGHWVWRSYDEAGVVRGTFETLAEATHGPCPPLRGDVTLGGAAYTAEQIDAHNATFEKEN